MSEEIWLVSACLLGRSCRYDGASANADAQKRASFLRGKTAIAVCPEELGGLGTPRPASRFAVGTGVDVLDGRGTLRDEGGKDVTAAFLRGAELAAGHPAATHACLKARSPSCGCGQVYSASGLVAGDGVFAALLRRRGLTIVSDEDVQESA